MENQHRKITGYRELSQAEIDLMNEIKAEGVKLGELHARVATYLSICAETKAYEAKVSKRSAEDEGSDQCVELRRFQAAEPARWAALGKTHFQEGLMALTRAVAQPTFF